MNQESTMDQAFNGPSIEYTEYLIDQASKHSFKRPSNRASMKLAKYQMDQLLDSFSIKWNHIRTSTDLHERRPKTYHLRTV